MTRFDRHENMSPEVLTEVSKIITAYFETNSVSSFGELSNYTYGLYDGFLYKNEILESVEFNDLREEDHELTQRILNVISEVEKYPILN